MPKTRSRYIVDKLVSSQPPQLPTRHPGLLLKLNQDSASTVEGPSSPMAPKDLMGANSTEPVKNQEAKSSFGKIIQKKFQKRASSLQEFPDPEGSKKVEDVHCGITGQQDFDHLHFSCKELTVGGLPQEYRLPPPFAPGHC